MPVGLARPQPGNSEVGQLAAQLSLLVALGVQAQVQILYVHRQALVQLQITGTDTGTGTGTGTGTVKGTGTGTGTGTDTGTCASSCADTIIGTVQWYS